MAQRGTKFLVTTESSVIPEEITHVKQVYILNINKAKFFKTGATSFDDFRKETSTELSSRIYRAIMQLYLMFGETLVATLQAKLAVVIDKGAQPADNEHGYIEIYMEAVLKKQEELVNRAEFMDGLDTGGGGGGGAEAIEYTDYTFYIFNRNPNGMNNVDGDEIFHNLIESIRSDYKEKKRTSGRSNRYGGGGGGNGNSGPNGGDMLPPYEKWRNAATVFPLSTLLDAYTGEVNGTELSDIGDMESLQNKKNPFIASRLFSMFTCMKARSNDTHPNQTAFSWQKYIPEPEPNTPTNSTFRFPLRKFVQKIPMVQLTVAQICQKYFPEYQLSTADREGAMLPIILSDYEHRIGLLPSDLRADPDSYLQQQRNKNKPTGIFDPRDEASRASDWYGVLPNDQDNNNNTHPSHRMSIPNDKERMEHRNEEDVFANHNDNDGSGSSSSGDDTHDLQRSSRKKVTSSSKQHNADDAGIHSDPDAMDSSYPQQDETRDKINKSKLTDALRSSSDEEEEEEEEIDIDESEAEERSEIPPAPNPLYHGNIVDRHITKKLHPINVYSKEEFTDLVKHMNINDNDNGGRHNKQHTHRKTSTPTSSSRPSTPNRGQGLGAGQGLKTKQEALAELAVVCGTTVLHNDNPVQLRIEDLARSAFIAHKKSGALTADELTAYSQGYLSCYSPLITLSRRNVEAITRLYQKMKAKTGAILVGQDKVKNPEHVLRKLLLLNKRQALHSYIQTCRSQDSDLSVYEKALMKYVIEKNLYETTIVTVNKFDKSLSMFANIEILRYMQLESLELIADRHREGSLSWKYAFNAWLMDFGLHLCLFTASKRGGVGKSFVWDILIKRLIPGTVEEESDRSEKAEATSEGNRNGRVVVMHEINQRLLREDNKSGTSDAERKFKECITSNKNRTRRLLRQDDGTWRQELTDTEIITVYLGSSNLNIAKLMSDAMKSRVHFIYFEDRAGMHERSLLEFKFAELLLSQTDKYQREKSRVESHLMQALFMEVERLIFIGVLEDVSMHVAMVILLIVHNRLKKEGMDIAHPRSYVRTLQLSRINCILEAITQTFFVPSSRLYGKPINPYDLLKLDRRLFCTCEHVVSAIGEQIDQFIDQTEVTVIKAIQTEFIANEKSRLYEEIRIPDPSYPTGYRSELNYNYIRFKFDKHMGSFCDSISSITERLSSENEESDTNMIFAASSDTVRATIERWKKRAIKSKKLRRHDLIDNEMVVIDESAEKNQLVAREGDHIIMFHWNFIFGKNRKDARSILVDIIKYIFEKDGQIEFPHHFVFDNDPQHPYIRNIIETGVFTDEELEERAKNGKPTGMLAIPTASCIDAFTKDILGLTDSPCTINESRYQPIDCDLDTYGINNRNMQLFIGKDPINPSFLNMKCLTEEWGSTAKVLYDKDNNRRKHRKRNRRDTDFLLTIANSNDEDSDDDDSEDDNDENREGGHRLPPTIDKYGVPTDEDYDDEIGYFLGIPLDIYKKGCSLEDEVEYTRAQLEKVVRNLDINPKLDALARDYDFDERDFIVSQEIDEESGVVLSTTYHWDLLQGSDMADKKMYKLVCYHPAVVNHFINLKCYYAMKEQSDYPQGFKERAEEARKQRWAIVEFYAPTPEARLEMLQKDSKAFLTWELTRDKHGEIVATKKRNSSWTAVDTARNILFRDTPKRRKFGNEGSHTSASKTTAVTTVLLPPQLIPGTNIAVTNNLNNNNNTTTNSLGQVGAYEFAPRHPRGTPPTSDDEASIVAQRKRQERANRALNPPNPDYDSLDDLYNSIDNPVIEPYSRLITKASTPKPTTTTNPSNIQSKIQLQPQSNMILKKPTFTAVATPSSLNNMDF